MDGGQVQQHRYVDRRPPTTHLPGSLHLGRTPLPPEPRATASWYALDATSLALLISAAAGRLWERKSGRRQTEAALVTLATARAARSVATSRPQPSQMEVQSCMPRPRHSLVTPCGPRLLSTVTFGGHRQLKQIFIRSLLSLVASQRAALLDIDTGRCLWDHPQSRYHSKTLG